MFRSRVIALVLAAVSTVAITAALAGAAREAVAQDASAATVGDRRYEHELREIEERVIGLKEAVFKAKTRLMLLQEEILQNVIAEARAVIVHHNDMGSTFTLERVVYYLDTNRIYVQDNRDGQLDENEKFEIFDGNVVPGNHLLTVEMDYRGNGTLFSYLDGYRFQLKANYTFFAAKGRVLQLTVVGYQKGDLTTDLKDRPSIKFQTQQFQYTTGFASPEGAPAAGGAAAEPPRETPAETEAP
jgi:hypothetical protein